MRPDARDAPFTYPGEYGKLANVMMYTFSTSAAFFAFTFRGRSPGG